MANLPLPRPSYVLFADGSAKGPELGWGVALWRAPGKAFLTLSRGELLGSTLTAFSEVAEWTAAVQALTLLGPKKRAVWLLTDCLSVATYLESLLNGAPQGVDMLAARVGEHLVTQLTQLALKFPKLHVLKVKGHAGSAGNALVDKLAGIGREDRRPRKGIVAFSLEHELELARLLKTGSVEYSYVVPAGTPTAHEVAKAKKREGKVVRKLAPEAIQSLTRGMTFELSAQERAAIAAAAHKMQARAEKLPKKTNRERNIRRSALDRAAGHVRNATQLLLQEKRKAAALRLANAR